MVAGTSFTAGATTRAGGFAVRAQRFAVVCDHLDNINKRAVLVNLVF